MQSILTINGGSSSIKFALYEEGEPLRRRLDGKVDRVGLSGTNFTFKDSTGKKPDSRTIGTSDHRSAVAFLLDWLETQQVFASVKAVGHRVVHGLKHSEPERVTTKLLADLHRITPYAPDHLPGGIALIKAFRRRCPKLTQVACFDTAFHRTMPRLAKLLPIPRRYAAKGVERYGFHGLSYAYLMEELGRLDPAAAKGRVILAHLGNGASLAAVLAGKSIDTSMGFTPTSGLVMGTRTGDLDPGLGYYLARAERMTAAQFHQMVNREPGLLGISGTSSDVRDLLALGSRDARAEDAVALFCYQAKKWIGFFAAALGGLDTLVFSGGIGENNRSIRARICEGLGFLGIELDEGRNWGTTPGLNFVYVHLNRVIKEHDLNAIYITGPGHGGPGLVANAYLEGTYSEVYPNIAQDADGMQRLFKQFSLSGGIPSHVAPETPGSIHEGGELGYSLSHAYGAAFDNPDLLVACVVGDGEAETGPLATSWHSNKFLNPVHDGAVLPILHLNGHKIAGPTVLARIPHDELEAPFRGYGYTPYFVEGDDPARMHQLMAATLDVAVSDIRRIQRDARKNGFKKRPSWPMIILRSPKGWTGPKLVDGKPTEGTFRSHQVPMGDMSHPGHVKILEQWLKGYRPQELFDKTGKLRSELADLAPKGERRMSANPHANGGLLLQDLRLPDFRDYAVKVKKPGGTFGESTRVQGEFIRDVIKLNFANFRIFSPDETNSNRWGAVFEVTDRCSTAEILPGDDHVAPDGRVMEELSEHQCEGRLEGYLLTGRHGFFSCYKAFIHIVDSMFNQHAKWLDVTGKIPWRRPIASLNYLLSSHVWRQDHNGFIHQDPGFIDVVANKKAEIVRVYLPPDANTLLSVTAHCLSSRNYVNVIVAGKQPGPQWLDMDAAIKHCSAGIGIWPWASNDQGGAPDVVMACCGDVPTLETLAAVELLRKYFPELKVRVINVVDLMKLQPQSEHPHGLSDKDFDRLSTKNKPVIFAHHGYPTLIHRLTYRLTNHKNLHVRGFKEDGSTSTPLDMVVMNDLDRFHLVADVIDRVPQLGQRAANVKQAVHDKLTEHKHYIAEHGDDLPEIRNWKWSTPK